MPWEGMTNFVTTRPEIDARAAPRQSEAPPRIRKQESAKQNRHRRLSNIRLVIPSYPEGSFRIARSAPDASEYLGMTFGGV